MTTTQSEFTSHLTVPEGTRLEFKEARTNFHFEELVKYCVALANEGGGKIIFGVSDARPRQVVGTAAFSEPGRTEAGLFQNLHCRIPVEEYQHQERALVGERFSAWSRRNMNDEDAPALMLILLDRDAAVEVLK